MSLSASTSREDSASLTAFFDVLANRHRRHLLRQLSSWSSTPMTPRELATSLAAQKQQSPLSVVTREQRKRASIALHHVHLPKLEAAGLIEWTADEQAVTFADHPALRDGTLFDVLADENVDPDSLDRIFGALANARRRTVLAVLHRQFDPVHAETLARKISPDELDTADAVAPAEEVGPALAVLLHHDIPLLAEAGLVEYDPDERTVTYRGHPALRVPWIRSILAPEAESRTEAERA